MSDPTKPVEFPPIAIIQRNALEQVRAKVQVYRGRVNFDLRVYYMDELGEWRPTKKGFNLHGALAPELEAMAAKVAAAVRAAQTKSSEAAPPRPEPGPADEGGAP